MRTLFLISVAYLALAGPQARGQNLMDLAPAPVSMERPAPQDADILSCPFASLRAAYLSLYTEVDQLNVAALESEVFLICTERQEQIRTILDMEQELNTLLEAQSFMGVASAAAIAPVSAPVSVSSDDAAAATSLKAAKADEIVNKPITCAAPYTTSAILGSPVLGEGLRAVIVDAATGTQLTVQRGDVLPGGLQVEEVSRSGVIVGAGGEREKLSNSMGLPEIGDGGGLVWQPTGIGELFGTPAGPGPKAGL